MTQNSDNNGQGIKRVIKDIKKLINEEEEEILIGEGGMLE